MTFSEYEHQSSLIENHVKSFSEQSSSEKALPIPARLTYTRQNCWEYVLTPYWPMYVEIFALAVLASNVKRVAEIEKTGGGRLRLLIGFQSV